MKIVPIFLLFACSTTEKGTDGSDIQNGTVLQDRDEDGYTADQDCDDNDDQINPGAEEICDGIDNDCNGEADERVTTVFHADADGDGYGSPIITTEACTVPIGYVSNGNDCNDTNAVAYPGAEEICDGVDNDCNDEVDENLDIVFYVDDDGDGYGDDDNVTNGCQAELGLSTIGGDCDDGDPSISPVANEICDDIDNDCDGSIDNGAMSTFYADNDEDGYGDLTNTTQACSAPAGRAARRATPRARARRHHRPSTRSTRPSERLDECQVHVCGGACLLVRPLLSLLRQWRREGAALLRSRTMGMHVVSRCPPRHACS